jgi:peroxidase
MKTGAGNLLPILMLEGMSQQTAGDERAIENPGLASLHTVFLREHNRIASGLKKLDSSLSDEELYQKARDDIQQTTIIIEVFSIVAMSNVGVAEFRLITI